MTLGKSPNLSELQLSTGAHRGQCPCHKAAVQFRRAETWERAL